MSKTVKQHAFMIYGTSPRAVRPLREAFAAFPGTRVVDVTGMTSVDIRSLHTKLDQSYTVHVFTRGDNAPLSESVIRHMATLGWMNESLARDIVYLPPGSDKRITEAIKRHIERIFAVKLVNEAGEVQKPKEPSEVDRLKDKQKQDGLLMKQRQQQDLLQAQRRELEKKSREKQQEITNGQRPKSITR